MEKDMSSDKGKVRVGKRSAEEINSPETDQETEREKRERIKKIFREADLEQRASSTAEIMNIIEKYNKMQEESAAEQNELVKKFNSQNDNY